MAHSKMSGLRQKLQGDTTDTETFWTSPITKAAGRVLIRPEMDLATESIFYGIRKNNKVGQKPSIIKLTRKAARELAEWGNQQLAEIDGTGCDDETIPSLFYHADLLGLEKSAANFWHPLITLTLPNGGFGNCRGRLCKNENGYSFYINNERKLDKFIGWNGPTIFLLKGEARMLFAAIQLFENELEE